MTRYRLGRRSRSRPHWVWKMPGLMAGQMYCRLHRTVTSAGTCPSCGSDEGDPAARAAKYPGITVVYDDPYDVNSPREDAHAPVRTILVIKDGA